MHVVPYSAYSYGSLSHESYFIIPQNVWYSVSKQSKHSIYYKEVNHAD
mgnify:CR=1 FL=1